MGHLLVWDTHFQNCWYGTPTFGQPGMGHLVVWDTHFTVLLVWDTHFTVWFGTPTLGCWCAAGMGHPL